MPPGAPAGIAGFGSGFSATIASVVTKSPATDAAFLERFVARLRPDITVVHEQLHVNDPEFGRRVGQHFLNLVQQSEGTTRT